MPTTTDALRRLPRSLLAILWLALACYAAPALARPWTALTPVQQEALAPLQQEWGKMTEKKQHYFLRLARRYPALSTVQKQRLQERLVYWSKLTPAQRARIRREYLAKKRAQRAKAMHGKPASPAASAPAAAQPGK